jgi:hypothetical protein
VTSSFPSVSNTTRRRGPLKLTLGDDTSVLQAWEAAIVRAGLRHSVRAIQRTHAIVVGGTTR